MEFDTTDWQHTSVELAGNYDITSMLLTSSFAGRCILRGASTIDPASSSAFLELYWSEDPHHHWLYRVAALNDISLVEGLTKGWTLLGMIGDPRLRYDGDEPCLWRIEQTDE